MLQGRLLKRLRHLGMKSFDEYCNYVFSPEGMTNELVHMIDVVTTNKTDFFREPKHFDFLRNQTLPTLLQSKHKGPLKRLNIWSAGCSSGEEPHTIAMVLAEFFRRIDAKDFTILATDISTHILAVAKKGIYPEHIVRSVPPSLKHKYLMRGKSSQTGLCRVIPELRNRINFQRLNLNDDRKFEIKPQMHIIFCRNVIIYFDRQTQIRLFEKFYDQLLPGGYMFIGHSETLHGINDRFVPAAVAVYRKPQ